MPYEPDDRTDQEQDDRNDEQGAAIAADEARSARGCRRRAGLFFIDHRFPTGSFSTTTIYHKAERRREKVVPTDAAAGWGKVA
jgi:hypothetical protein